MIRFSKIVKNKWVWAGAGTVTVASGYLYLKYLQKKIIKTQLEEACVEMTRQLCQSAINNGTPVDNTKIKNVYKTCIESLSNSALKRKGINESFQEAAVEASKNISEEEAEQIAASIIK